MDHKALKAFVGRTNAAEEALTGILASRFKATFDLPVDSNSPLGDALLVIHFCIAPDVCPTEKLRALGYRCHRAASARR